MNHPRNIGRVSLRSPDPNDPPMIQLNYLENQSDVKRLVDTLKLIRQIFQSSAFDEFRGREVAPGADVQSDADIAAYIRQTCGTVFHPIGTCKMGTDSMAVVDSELRVYGVEGLRVVDASIMPTIITGHINAPTIMIGEKAADLIKATKQWVAARAAFHWQLIFPKRVAAGSDFYLSLSLQREKNHSCHGKPTANQERCFWTHRLP
ncbi:MAG TPA: GMC oxidoreductase [Coleofasciculaceae cyanobacterium]